MVNHIQTSMVDMMIENATVLCQGHASCYEAGWPGLIRARTKAAYDNTGASIAGVTDPTAGWINLYDKPFAKDAENTRPGIYVGIETHEFSDSDDGKQVSSGHQIKNRFLDIPFVVVVSDQDPYICRDKRNQLRDNVMKIILANVRRNGAWWSFQAPGEAGGGNLAEHAWITGTAQNTVGMYEAYSVIPIRVKYSFTGATPP